MAPTRSYPSRVRTSLLCLLLLLPACGGGGGSGAPAPGDPMLVAYAEPGDPAFVVAAGELRLLINRLMVLLAPGAAEDAIRAMAERHGGRVVGKVRRLGLVTVQLEPAPPDVAGLDARARALEAETLVRGTMYDLVLDRRDVAPSDVQDGYGAVANGRAQLWAYDRVQAQAAWNLLATLRADGLYAPGPVRVAVVDSGLDTAHTEFTGIDTSRSADYSVNPPGMDLADPDGHGTAVSSLVAARTGDGGMNGLLGAVPGLVYNLQMHKASGNVPALSSYIAALQGALNVPAADRAQVVNLSWGMDVPDRLDTLEQTLRVQNAFTTLRGLFQAHPTILFVIAASNLPYDGSDDPNVLTALPVGSGAIDGVDLPGSIDEPNVLTVAGIQSTDDRRSGAGGSSFGPHIDLCAPSRDLYVPVAGGGYTLVSGNSFAAPLVAATAALLLSLDPGLGPTGAGGARGLRELLRDAALPITVNVPAAETPGSVPGTQDWRALKAFDALRLLLVVRGIGAPLGHTTLAYTALSDAGPNELRTSQLRRAPGGGSEGFRTLTEGTDAGRHCALSWDGRWLAWSRDADVHRVAMLTHLSATWIATPTAAESWLAWTPSGRLLFVRETPGVPGPDQIRKQVLEFADPGTTVLVQQDSSVPAGGDIDLHHFWLAPDALAPRTGCWAFTHLAAHVASATSTVTEIPPTVLLHPVDTYGEPPAQVGGVPQRFDGALSRFTTSWIEDDPLVQDAFLVYRDASGGMIPGGLPLRVALLRHDRTGGDPGTYTILNDRVLHPAATSSATWSPDGSELLFASGAQLLAVRTSRISALVLPGAPPPGYDPEARVVLTVAGVPPGPVEPVLSPSAAWSVQR